MSKPHLSFMSNCGFKIYQHLKNVIYTAAYTKHTIELES